jgi:DNA segregation ATPase FtsK/SpoIIIE-like protein
MAYLDSKNKIIQRRHITFIHYSNSSQILYYKITSSSAVFLNLQVWLTGIHIWLLWKWGSHCSITWWLQHTKLSLCNTMATTKLSSRDIYIHNAVITLISNFIILVQFILGRECKELTFWPVSIYKRRNIQHLTTNQPTNQQQQQQQQQQKM